MDIMKAKLNALTLLIVKKLNFIFKEKLMFIKIDLNLFSSQNTKQLHVNMCP